MALFETRAATPNDEPISREGKTGKLVAQFREILLWPLQLMPLKEGLQIYHHWEVLRNWTGSPWEELLDEFIVEPPQLQERHYREFVTFLPHVQGGVCWRRPTSMTARNSSPPSVCIVRLRSRLTGSSSRWFLITPPETWDAMVARGELPPPDYKIGGTMPRWKWTTVESWLSGMGQMSTMGRDPYVEAAERPGHGKTDSKRRCRAS